MLLVLFVILDLGANGTFFYQNRVQSHLPLLFALLRTFLILVAEAVDRWTSLFAFVFLLFALSSCVLLSFELDAFDKFLALSVFFSILETFGLIGRFLYPRERTPTESPVPVLVQDIAQSGL